MTEEQWRTICRLTCAGSASLTGLAGASIVLETSGTLPTGATAIVCLTFVGGALVCARRAVTAQTAHRNH